MEPSYHKPNINYKKPYSPLSQQLENHKALKDANKPKNIEITDDNDFLEDQKHTEGWFTYYYFF